MYKKDVYKMSIPDFLKDLENTDGKIKSYFNNVEDLKKSLIELNNVIGMEKIKIQILNQIKTYISNKAKGIYKESDRKHCLLCGPPGCGKTTIGKILCKVWISIGFIGRTSSNSVSKKVVTFNKAQDEMIRNQRQEIKEYKDRLRTSINIIGSTNRINMLCKRSISNLIKLKNGNSNSHIDVIIGDISSANNFLEDCQKNTPNMNKIKHNSMQGFGIEEDSNMIGSKDISDLPFHVYNRNDVVSRYVGDTTHRCTKAMTEALDGVAYFDEAYNLCNDSNGFGDSYGRVALTTINQFMDEHADKLIVVFAGYKEDIYNNLFQAQKGLESRFTNKFEIEKYTPGQLTKIFIQRLAYAEWFIQNTPELNKIISDNFSLFEYQGRDMDTLALYTKNIISEQLYEDVMAGKSVPTQITDLDIIRKAVEVFKQNMIGKGVKKTSDLQKMVEMLGA